MSTAAVLGLDLGTSCGWALAQGGRIYSGTWDLAPRRGDSPGMRMLMLRSNLQSLPFPVKLCVYERPHLRGGFAASVLTHLEGEVQSWCAQESIQHHAVHSGTLKKFATGHGHASKDQMVQAATIALCYYHVEGSAPVINDDNQADAIHLCRYGLELLGRGA